MNKFLKTGLLAAGIALTGIKADAQVYPYFADFETDSIKAYASTAPVLLNGRNWVMPGVFLGEMVPTSDKYNGQHAARIRRTDNTTGDNGSMTMQSDLAQGIGSVTLYHGRYGSEAGSTFRLYYSTNAGSTWTPAGADITTASTLTAVTIPVNVSGPARISIRKTDTSASRINIDDILVTGFNGYATNVVMIARTPLGANVPLSTNNLTFKFNEAVSKGTTGNIVLHNATDNTTQVKAVTAADVVVSGQDVTISNITLASNKSYYVTYDSAAFIKTAGTLKSTGIYTTTGWVFSSEDTSVAPPMTSLNETFTTCNDPDLGVFTYVSKTGSQTWRCGTQGHTDANAVYINGGFSGGANDNEDWLITNAPINLASTSNPVLEFWEKIRYTGATTKNVVVSTNYAGSGDPSLATWTTIKDVTNESSTDWTVFSNISLSAYQATPFYLAFKYISAAASGGAQEWSIDDVKISAGSAPSGISERKLNGMGLSVLGNATSDQIVLGITLKESTTLNITAYDITGRKVYEASQHMQEGVNQYKIQDLHLTKGLYVIHVNDATHSGVIKAPVQ